MSKQAVIAIALALFISSASQVQAQEQVPPTQESAVLDAVVVTAGRSAEQLKSVSVPVTIIEEADMARVNAQDLPDLLRHYGLQVNQLGGSTGLTRVAMRGFGTSTSPNDTGDVVILLDGRKIGNNNIGMVSLQNIARVEVVRGAASVQYGSAATGGVINLISKRGQEKASLFVEQTLGSWNSSKTQAGFSGQLGKFDFSVGGSYFHADDYSVSDGTLYGRPGSASSAVPGGGVYKNTSVHGQQTMGANLGFNFNENHRLGLVYSGYYGTQGRPGDLRNGGVSNSPDGYGQRKNYSWDVLYEGQAPSVNLNWQARAYTGTTRYTTASNWYRSPKTGYYDYGTDFDGLEAQARWSYENFHLTAGIEQYAEDYWQINTPPYSSKYTDTAGYLLGKLSFLDERLWLNAGVRYDSIESEGQQDPQKASRYTPAFGVSYSPAEWVKVRANYAGAFKMPTPDRLTGDSTSSGGIRYLGNPSLKPEKADNWDFGADFYYQGLEVGLTYFSTDYENMISTRRIQNTPRIDTYVNLEGTSKYRGLEANFSWNMGETFGWDFNVRPYLSLTQLFTYEKPDGSDLETVADRSLAYGLSFDHPAYGLSVSLDASYYGEQLPSSGSTTWGGVRFGGDSVVDFHLSKVLYDWEDYGKLTLKGDILNLTDKLYQVAAGYPQPGRAFYLGIRYDY